MNEMNDDERKKVHKPQLSWNDNRREENKKW
jgi:hypothetical protein